MNQITLQINGKEPVTVHLVLFGVSYSRTYYPLPETPADLIASQDLLDEIQVTWSPVSYADKYIIWRNGAFHAEAIAPPFVDGGIFPGSVYSYQVSAVNSAGEGAPTAEVVGHTVLPPHDVWVQVGKMVGTSRLRVGIAHADNSLMWGHTEAVARAKDALRGKVALQKTFIQSWGPGRIWPYDGSPTGPLPTDPKTINWSSLDKQMGILRDIGSPILIAFFMLPWWMRGKLDGTPCTLADEWEQQAGRLRTDCVSHWQTLVREIALRYLVQPYNVREFEVGAEPKGFYNRRDGKAQSWEWDDYVGTPGKADMGWTAFYKFTVEAVLDAASSLGIARKELRFWGPYSTTGSRTVAPTADQPPVGHPLRDRPWGYMMKAPIEFVSRFLDLWQDQKFPLDGLMVDGGTHNRDDTPLDPWVALTKLEDVMNWLRSECIRIGVPDFPIAWGEFYPNSQVAGTEKERALLRAEAMRLMLLHETDYLMAWQAQGPVPGPSAQLYTDPEVASGGAAKPQLSVLELFNRLFPPATPLYEVEVKGNSFTAVATDKDLLLINRSEQAQDVWVDGKGRVVVSAKSWQVFPL